MEDREEMEGIEKMVKLLQEASKVCSVIEAIPEIDVNRLEKCLHTAINVSQLLTKAQQIKEWMEFYAAILSPEAVKEVLEFVKKYENVLPAVED